MEGTSGAWLGGREELAHPRDDPYADGSIACGAQAALPVVQRENRKLKRKVLRHRPDGRVEVCDETVNSDPECSAELWSLGKPSVFLDDTISEGEISDSLEAYEDEWLLEDCPCSLLGDLGSRSVSQYSARVGSPTSYIAPPDVKPKRIDPVARFREYRQDWERYSFPGEDPHDSLRWAVRRRMAQPGLPRQAPKRLVPNTYVVPTTKDRTALRWAVRHDLAHCLMPRRNTS
ncbi:centriolar and ciliogenesis-associated protein HYLS1 [Pithys albifrons albifrons]|uniref:centriolar and ciliogenesis-associated protein HYLS1 n=1 Tax=Pithys albifrons albifrons TaxID=3385563 RepID=UPI003A5D1BF9